MHLKDLKKNTPAELVSMAEEAGIEGASTMRKQDLMFSILKVRAEAGAEIMGMGTIEVLNDGFGFLRSPEANYLAGPDDIYVAPNLVRRFGLRTGDTFAENDSLRRNLLGTAAALVVISFTWLQPATARRLDRPVGACQSMCRALRNRYVRSK